MMRTNFNSGVKSQIENFEKGHYVIVNSHTYYRTPIQDSETINDTSVDSKNTMKVTKNKVNSIQESKETQRDSKDV